MRSQHPHEVVTASELGLAPGRAFSRGLLTKCTLGAKIILMIAVCRQVLSAWDKGV